MAFRVAGLRSFVYFRPIKSPERPACLRVDSQGLSPIMKPCVLGASQWFWASLFCLLSLSTRAQPQSFIETNSASPYVVTVRHFSMEQGLPNRFVLTVGQDREGLLWLGTLENAYRFDGHRFEPLPPVAKRPANAPYSPYVHSICRDHTGSRLYRQWEVVASDHQTGPTPTAVVCRCVRTGKSLSG